MSTWKNRAGAAEPVSMDRYRPFGLFRLALAAMVLVQHCLLLLPAAHREIFYDLELGAIAVTCFFGVSGFIVAEALSHFYDGRPGAFLINRLLRLVPPYLLVLVMAIGVQSALYRMHRLVPLDAPLEGPPWQPRVILAALCEIVPGLPSWRISGETFSFVPFAWTLRVEFAFYGVAFATACGMVWARKRGLPGRRWVAGLAIGIFYVMFARFVLRHGAGAQQVLCVPFFAFGLACYLHALRPGAIGTLHLLAVAVCVPLAFTYWGQKGHPVLAYQLPCVCALFAALYGLTRITRVPARVRRLDRWSGDLSYPLYIGHGVVVVTLLGLADHRGWGLYALGIAGSLVLAVILHRLAETPLRGLRDRLRGCRV
jgi:peptidoglycan/LPS O-acetylase OafA/YrhL